jgi:signal peptidase I
MAKNRRSYQHTQFIMKRFLYGGGLFLLIFWLFVGLQNYVIAIYAMPNEGMEPYLRSNQRIVIQKFGWGEGFDKLPALTSIKRGDVVLINLSEESQILLWQLINPFIRLVSGNFYWLKDSRAKQGLTNEIIKRVIALPGDTIKMDNNVIMVRPAGERFFISEFESSTKAYETFTTDSLEAWPAYGLLSSYMHEQVLPPNTYFVAGDNRVLINDSRSFGLVRKEQIQGLMIAKIF